MSSAPQRLERRPVYEQVADALRESILSGSMPPGSALPTERELCKRFGVGRTTIREALRALQSKGLAVATGPTSPLQVVAPDALTTEPLRDTLEHLLRLGRVSIGDLVSFGAMLEGAGAEQVAESDPRPDLTAARDQIAFMRAADADVEAFELADFRFHVALVQASGSEALTLVVIAVRNAVSPVLLSRLKSLADPRSALARLIAEHEDILQATLDGDGEAARRLACEHVRRCRHGFAE